MQKRGHIYVDAEKGPPAADEALMHEFEVLAETPLGETYSPSSPCIRLC
jgi:hypothetical protein